MKKPEVDPEIYKAWDAMQKRMVERDQKSLFPTGSLFPQWDDVYPLTSAISFAPKAMTGRNRKKDEEAVLVPRFVLKFLIDKTLAYIVSMKPKKEEDHDAAEQYAAE